MTSELLGGIFVQVKVMSCEAAPRINVKIYLFTRNTSSILHVNHCSSTRKITLKIGISQSSVCITCPLCAFPFLSQWFTVFIAAVAS